MNFLMLFAVITILPIQIQTFLGDQNIWEPCNLDESHFKAIGINQNSGMENLPLNSIFRINCIDTDLTLVHGDNYLDNGGYLRCRENECAWDFALEISRELTERSSYRKPFVYGQTSCVKGALFGA